MKNKILLVAIGFLSLLMGQRVSAQIVLLQQNFDATFLPTGWTDSTVKHTGTGGPKWGKSPGSPAIPTPLATIPGITAGFTPTAPAPSSGHNGSPGMAWYNSGKNASGDSASLVTPLIHFPLSTGGASTRLSFWLYSDKTTSLEAINVWFNTVPCACTDSVNGYTKQLLGSFQPNKNNAIPPYWTNYVINTDNIPQPPPLGVSPYPGNYYIIFEGAAVGGTGASDLYIDDIEVDSVPVCTGVPSIGVVTAPPKVCSSFSFTMSVNDTSVANGITYVWQSSSPDSTSWVNMPSTNSTTITTSITTPTYFRARAICGTSLDTASTRAILVTLNPFYLCYCQVGVPGTLNDNISSVAIYTTDTFARALTPLLTNGIPPIPATSTGGITFHAYTNYQSVTPTVLHLDSLYLGRIYSMGSTYTDSVFVFIDYNQSGTFGDDTSELVFKDKAQSATAPYGKSDTFRVPPIQFLGTTVKTGLTGMRVYQYHATSTATVPAGGCGTSTDAEVEDYLVNIELDNCNGFPNAGFSLSPDSALCPPTGTSITNNTHDHNEVGLSWYWQQSIDSGQRWAPAPVPADTDVIVPQYTGPTWYRLALSCAFSHDTSFSNNVILVNNTPNYCDSCYSYANGVGSDSSDIGAFGFGPYLFERQDSINNPHLNNPLAYREHTDYTGSTMSLVVGNKYHVFAYQIMKRAHSDGKFTLFIDYNNNHRYDPATELLWTAFTRADTFFLSTDITIPHSGFVVPDKPLTMRLILNSNTSPNPQSDSACGKYISGETQDFIVVIHDSTHLNVGTINNLSDLAMYPNPTSGKFNISFTTPSLIKSVGVRVTNVTGQQIMVRNYSNITGDFNTELDLSNQPAGLYFIEFVADGQRIVHMETVN